MPKVGDKEFPYTPEGIAAAKAASMATGIPSPEISTTGMPMVNAQDRSQMYYMGGKVEGKGYKKGGKVKK